MWQVGLNARGVALSLVCLACVFITLWVAIGASVHKNYETPTPVRNSPLSFPHYLHHSGQDWCWINARYSGDRLAGEYVWMWIALFASVMLYIPLYFWAEGYWSVDEHNNFHWSSADRIGYAQRRATLGMLL